MRGNIKSLNLGASAAPRIAQAASQSHVSRVGTSRCSLSEGMNGSEDCIVPSYYLNRNLGYSRVLSTKPKFCVLASLYIITDSSTSENILKVGNIGLAPTSFCALCHSAAPRILLMHLQ